MSEKVQSRPAHCSQYGCLKVSQVKSCHAGVVELPSLVTICVKLYEVLISGGLDPYKFASCVSFWDLVATLSLSRSL